MKKLLIAVFLVFSFCPQQWQTCAQSDPGTTHFNLTVDSVNQIASELVSIYENDCDENECTCSLDRCRLLPEDSNPICFPSKSNLYNCSEILKEELGIDANLCYSIRLASRSSVTYVRSNGEVPSEDQTKTICRTQKLDELFQTVSNKTNLYMNYYVGMIDGSSRNFPGREEIQESCSDYDSRIRPWYTAAISHPNHLVILLDVGHEMTKDPGLRTDKTRINLSIEFASSLIKTVYEGDYLNLFSFGASDEPFVKPTLVLFNSDDPGSHPELNPLNKKIMSLKATTTSTLPSQFAAGLNTAMRAFNETESTVGLLNVVVITDGSFSSDESFYDSSFKDVINQVKTRGVRVFIYGINAGAYVAQLKGLSQDINGIFQDTVYTNSNWNPLLVMQSYFGYLATCHVNLYGDTPFWSTNYKDYYNVGDIVTVSKAAITKNGTLVGVAAIDIIFNELEHGVIQGFENAVIAQRNSQDAKSKTVDENNTAPATIPGSLIDSSCMYNRQPVDVLCPAEVAESRKGGIDLRCCNRCSQQGDKTTRNIIVGVVVGGVLLCVIGIGTICFLFKPKMQKVPETKVPLDPTMANDPRWTVGL